MLPRARPGASRGGRRGAARRRGAAGGGGQRGFPARRPFGARRTGRKLLLDAVSTPSANFSSEELCTSSQGPSEVPQWPSVVVTVTKLSPRPSHAGHEGQSPRPDQHLVGTTKRLQPDSCGAAAGLRGGLLGASTTPAGTRPTRGHTHPRRGSPGPRVTARPGKADSGAITKARPPPARPARQGGRLREATPPGCPPLPAGSGGRPAPADPENAPATYVLSVSLIHRGQRGPSGHCTSLRSAQCDGETKQRGLGGPATASSRALRFRSGAAEGGSPPPRPSRSRAGPGPSLCGSRGSCSPRPRRPRRGAPRAAVAGPGRRRRAAGRPAGVPAPQDAPRARTPSPPRPPSPVGTADFSAGASTQRRRLPLKTRTRRMWTR